MGVRINTNVAALNAQRNLSNSALKLNQTLERLSTGLRINRAADDAAGMAISSGLTSQIQGLKQVIRNSDDAISMVSTAESAIAEQVFISQRLRELSVQAANGAISDYDRGNIQKEVDQLLEEFDRIATQTSFNGVSLLNGQFGTKDLQVGTNKGESIRMTLNSTRISTVGGVATQTGIQRTGTTTLATVNSFTINGISITGFSSDGISSLDGSKSSIAIATAINALSGSTGVTAKVQPTIYTASRNFSQAFTFTNSATGVVLNGVNITGSGQNISDAIDMINNFSNQTGVKATGISGKIVLEAADGRNIEINATGSNAKASQIGIITATTISRVYASAINLTSDDKFTLAAATGVQTISSIGITSTTYSTDPTTTVDTLSVLTTNSAGNSIEIMDNTLRQLNNIRSKIGAVQNRLESTRRNLSATQENLSAARSRILDADIAIETAELTKMQILQQAGISVLSQANMSPQAVLSLLKG